MKIEIVHLKNYYPIIEQFGADPVLELMIQENFLKSLMRPVVLILPGGGDTMTARAEGQNVGVEFLTTTPDGSKTDTVITVTDGPQTGDTLAYHIRILL